MPLPFDEGLSMGTVVEKERCTFDGNGRSIEIDGRVQKIRAIAIPERESNIVSSE